MLNKKNWVYMSRKAMVSALVLGSMGTASAHADSLVNVGKAVDAAIAYHDTGAYQNDFDQQLKQAQRQLEQERLQVKKTAIVLDIDETTLSNWPEMRANGLGYIPLGSCDHLPSGPCGHAAWTERAEEPSFNETRALIHQAQAHHVAVFFITGRTEKDRQATEKNLQKEGITGWAHLYMRAVGDNRSAEAYKTPLRAGIEQQGYTIVANIGDQESDLMGGHARHTYLLPNPFYYIP